MAYLEKLWIDTNWLKKASYEESSVSGLPTDKPSNNFLIRYSSSDKCAYIWQGDGTGINGNWSKGMGGGGITPEVKNANFKAKTGTLYLCDVSTNSINIDLSNFLTLNTETTLYECNLSAGDYFEVYIVKGDSTLNTVTLSFTGLQASPYNYNLNLEGESGSDFIFDNNSYFRFTYSGDTSIGFKINSMTGAVPAGETIGVVKSFAGFTTPSGYFFVDGSSKSRVDYEELFNVITFSMIGTLTSGTKNITTSSTSGLYIGEKIEGTGIPVGTTIASITNSTTFVMSNNATITGSTSILVLPYGSLTPTTFKIPDYRGKVIVMPDGTTEFKAVGMTGGERSHMLTTSEMAKHSHFIQGYTRTNYDPDADMFQNNVYGLDTGSGAYWSSEVGNNQAHNNLQPYGCSNYIIKY